MANLLDQDDNFPENTFEKKNERTEKRSVGKNVVVRDVIDGRRLCKHI